jgi:hypothetical protein
MSDILSNTSPDAISRLHSGQLLLSFNLLSEHRSGLQRRHHTSLNPCRPRVSVPCSFDRQGGFLVRPCGLRLVAVSLLLLCPLLTSPIGSGSMTLPSAITDGPWEISQGKTQNVPCIDAGLIQHTPCGWRTLPSRARSSRVVPHLVSGSCSSPRTCGLGFLQTPPRGGRPCPFPSLRLRDHLARGRSPRSFCAVPGTHARGEPRQQPERGTSGGCWRRLQCVVRGESGERPPLWRCLGTSLSAATGGATPCVQRLSA